MDKKKEEKSGTKKKKHKSKAWRKAKFIIQLLFLLFLLAILILGIVFYQKYGKNILGLQQEAVQIVKNAEIETFRQTETSLVYDADGELMSVLKGAKDVKYLEYNDIPDYAKEAMISIEDKKFLTHKGVDYKAVLRAGVSLVRNMGSIHEGASTITQQLSRNIFLTHEVSWERKVKEMFIAMELEKKFTKKHIMEFYLNNIYFANGYYGIQAAANGYFSKDANELSLSQIAFLCAIPNSPTRYDPIVNSEATLKRRDRILKQMMDDGKITFSEYNHAIDEDISLYITTVDKINYVETFVYYSATRSLMQQQGFEFRNEFDSKEDKEAYEERYSEMYNECQQSLFNSGYRIYTSIDLEKQDLLQDSVDSTLKEFKDKTKDGIYEMQGAAVSIDNETGRVVAVVGGRSQKTKGYTLNRAYQSYRQPGSAIKPLIVYTPAFEEGYTPNDIVMDEKFEGGPSNSNGVFSGKMTIRKAVESSKNTIAWRIFEELTPRKGLNYLLKMNFNRLDANDYYPAASLGGFTHGTSPVEMAAGFATIENDGVYREPTCIVKITDSEGKEIVSDKPISKPVYEQNASRMMTDVLTGVLKYGTGRGLALQGMASAGKTGTTNEKKDGWFVGYTPYYTTSVWVGYDMPKQLSNLTGASYPGNIWKAYMTEIHKGLDYKNFPAYKKPPKEIIEEPEEEEELPSVELDDLIEDEPEDVLPDDNEDDGTIDEGDGIIDEPDGEIDDGSGEETPGNNVDDGQGESPPNGGIEGEDPGNNVPPDSGEGSSEDEDTNDSGAEEDLIEGQSLE